MPLTTKQPFPGDSDNHLIYKLAVNLFIIASDVQAGLEPPRFGSSDNLLLAKAVLYTDIIASS